MKRPGRERILTVEGEQFRVRLRRRAWVAFEYDYEWLTGPHPGVGWSVSCSFRPSEGEHRAWIQEFLAEVGGPSDDHGHDTA